MRYTVRPITDRTWLRPTTSRQVSQFTASYPDTLDMLGREIEWLKGRDVAIEVDVPESGIRRDGQGVLADARSESPAVVVAFESVHGPLYYRCDGYLRGPATRLIKGQPVRVMPSDWQHNLRAIVLTLEALRAVDRYGATETGQQYAGFKALPAGRAMGASHMTSDEAWSILGSFGSRPISEQRLAGAAHLRTIHRAARAFAHPDRHNGDRELWDQVERAAAVLGVQPS